MGIGKISDYGSLIQNYRVPSIPTVDESPKLEAQAVRAAEKETKLAAPALQEEEALAVAVQTPAQISPQDASLDLKGNGSFEFIGRDSDMQQLDINKAISDMKKDSILEQYQFFVGTQNVQYDQSDTDGIVIIK